MKTHNTACKDDFEYIKLPFEIHIKDPDAPPDSKKKITVIEERYLAYCKDIDALEKKIRAARGIDDKEKLKKHWGIDGGGEHFKICVNFISEKLKENSPKNAKKRKNRHLQSSVRATQIIAIVEEIPGGHSQTMWIILDPLNPLNPLSPL